MGKKKQPTPAPTAPAAATPAAASGPTGPYNEVLSGYEDFANTGGFKPEDLANIRARSLEPIRAVYANAQREVTRNKALQGGYSPGFQAAMAKMAREQSYAQADKAIDTEAELAQQIREGRLAGLHGLSGLIDSGGGGGGGTDAQAGLPIQEEKKPGFWSKFGKIAGKVGQVALPIVLSPIPGGSIAGSLISGAMASKGLGKGKGIGTGPIPGYAQVPNIQPARR